MIKVSVVSDSFGDLGRDSEDDFPRLNLPDWVLKTCIILVGTPMNHHLIVYLSNMSNMQPRSFSTLSTVLFYFPIGSWPYS